MMRGMRAGRALAGGLAAGAALALILCVAASALAVLTGATVGIPGFFSAQADLGRVVFTPDWGAVALVSVGSVIAGVAACRPSEKG